MQGEAGSKALEKHDAIKRLRDMLKTNPTGVMDYMKTLSPSGVELEILSLTTFEFGANNDPANHFVS
jgi:hypothetical protein